MAKVKFNTILVLVYGPSGVGKTTAIRMAKDMVPEAEFASLDDLVAFHARKKDVIGEGEGAGELLRKLGADGFLQCGIEAAAERRAISPMGAVVLDVGAGFLDSRRTAGWLAAHTSIVFTASPEVAYRRQQVRLPTEPRTLESYANQEFSSRRCEIYAKASHRIDAERASDEVGRALAQLILKLTSQEPPT